MKCNILSVKQPHGQAASKHELIINESLFLHAVWHRVHPNDPPEGTIRVFYTLLSQRNASTDVRDRAGDCVLG